VRVEFASTVVLLAALASVADAAPGPVPAGQVAFLTFGTEEGLTNLVVSDTLEDRDGAIWVATEDGLFRLDGSHFTRFGVEAGLSSSRATVLALAPTGELCVGSSTDLACGRDGHFTSTPIPGGTRLLAATPDALWVASADGLWVRRGTTAPRPAGEGPQGPITLLSADERGVLAGSGTAIHERSPTGGWRPLDVNLADAVRADPIRELRRDPSGAVWLRAIAHVWRVAPGQRELHDLSYGLPRSGEVEFGRAMAFAPTGEVVLATDAGIALLRGEHWEIIDRRHGLPGGGVSLVRFARDGQLWLGGIGLHLGLGRGLLESHTSTTGLPGEAAWAIAHDASGRLLLGTDRCLARAVADGATATWACLPKTTVGIIRAIAPAPDGGVYFGGSPAVLWHLAPTGEVTSIATFGDDPAIGQVFAATLTPDGTLWIGTNVGLWRRPPGRGLEPLPSPEQPTKLDYVAGLLIDGPRLWVTGGAGLRVLEDGRWTRFTVRDGLRATPLRSLIKRRDGRICVAYDDSLGVSCFRLARGELTQLRHYDGTTGLDATLVYSVGEDHDGRLWLGTGAGVRVLSDDPGVPIDRFTAYDGLAGDDSAASAFAADDDGTLWIGSTAGLTRVRAGYHGPPPPPTVRLLELVAGAGVPAGTDPSTMRVVFTANRPDDPTVAYQVRLLPRDDTWTTSHGREFRERGLAPGAYQLEVRASTHGGPWGPITTVPIVIPPRWWQARWVIPTLILAALGLFVTVGGLWQRTSLRRKTRLLLAQTDAGFRAFLAAVPDVVVVQRADGVRYLNGAARALFGEDGERRGMWLIRKVDPADRRALAALLRAPQRAAPIIELRVEDGDAWRILEVSHQQLTLVGVEALVLLGRDVTERRRLDAKMLIADRMVSMGTLAAGIAHEINNPLAYVLGNLEIVAEALAAAPTGAAAATATVTLTPDDRAELSAAVADALDGAGRVRTIVRGLATFNRSEEERRIEVPLPEVIDHAVRLTHNEVRHSAELKLELGNTPKVIGDPGRLTQVLINLLINARHAIPPGAADRHHVTIRTRAGGDGTAILEVEDNGAGMPPEVLAHAFDPFFTTKRIGEGTGLGLSICHGIITGLGGKISLDSVVGRGTTVRLTLPGVPPTTTTTAPTVPPLAARATPLVVAAPVPAVAVRPSVIAAPDDHAVVAPAAAATIAAGSRPRVLVVDDDVSVANVLARLLRGECEVTVLSNGEDVVRLVTAGERFDVILTDVMMPVMSGLELRDQLAEIAPSQARRIAFITGGVFSAETSERLELLAVPTLAKPVDAVALRRVVRHLAEA
jgi:signal transduction histidine kinase/ligand-binding sensor domain-containing protein/ActR/RegA family two-component response regulator